jgi:hypothetical protein
LERSKDSCNIPSTSISSIPFTSTSTSTSTSVSTSASTSATTSASSPCLVPFHSFSMVDSPVSSNGSSKISNSNNFNSRPLSTYFSFLFFSQKKIDK